MIPRYSDPAIAVVWTDEAKLKRWDEVELAVIAARVNCGEMLHEIYRAIKNCLDEHPADIGWWLAREKEVGHDLNAYIDERRRHIPEDMQFFFHKDMTSFDTEEAAFARALRASAEIVLKETDKLDDALREKARQYRYTPMLDRTHGQGAKLCSFGGRMLTYIAELNVAYELVERSHQDCDKSRLSGAIGNYGGGLDPRLEKEALRILGFSPFYGATQILPRSVYAPLGQSLLVLVKVVEKMAVDVRLGARSGNAIVQEPFGKKQKGSSAMPHKKNTISTEKMTGMARLAEGCESSIVRNIETWERRAIEQSSVERVAWPDLFHTTMHMLSTMQKVISGLTVYPDNMLREIVEARGTYASEEAKNFLAEELAKRKIGAEVAYRIAQLASFNAFEPGEFWARVRERLPESLEDADLVLQAAKRVPPEQVVSIQDIIPRGHLSYSAQLEASPEEVAAWNDLLRSVFDEDARKRWDKLFSIPHLLRNEGVLFSELLP